MYPLYIPSIYRHNSEFLINIRDIKPELKYYIIIASHQYENYAKNFNPSNLVILPDDIIRISEIRQFILDLAIRNKETKIWMSDDDLLNFFNSSYKPKEKSDLESKLELEKVDFKTFITNSEKIIEEIYESDKSIIQFGFKYTTFALSKNQKPYTINTNIGMIQLLVLDKIIENDIKYDTSFITLEDTDFTIQLFKHKLKNCQLNNFIFTAPRSGKGKGGLEKEYNMGAKQKGILQFQEKYNSNNIIKIINLEKGKYKINWLKFKNTF
jgi:hypothetical protein